MRKYGSANLTYGERCWSVFGNICKKCGILTEVGNICDIKITHLWPGIYGVHLKCKTIKTITCYNFPMLNKSCFSRLYVVKTINDFVIHHTENKKNYSCFSFSLRNNWDWCTLYTIVTIVSYIAWARANDSNATTS